MIMIYVAFNVTHADKCPGFQHNVVIPNDYVKHVPDSRYTGNVTGVKFGFGIKQIKEVKEERSIFYEKKIILFIFEVIRFNYILQL